MQLSERTSRRRDVIIDEKELRPALSVVVPVYDGAETIVDNVNVIRRAVEAGVDGEIELIVVSDGSIDATEELLLAARPDMGARVIHYDRNLGKGYAVRTGALAARGEWIAFIDADLDLDPASLPLFLEIATAEQLDFAIGSKRHPASVVFYPRSRRAASWCYQQLNRILFRLDVRDTQVGIKLFRREIADRVIPLLLVKQFAFDLELLAVSRALGFTRVRELPVRLDYRFTGSGVRSSAVLRALIDTAAVFYRLRVLKTYQRKRLFLRLGDRTEGDGGTAPLVSLIGADPGTENRIEYSRLEVMTHDDRLAAALAARGSLVAVTTPRSRPGGNWLTTCVQYFVRPSVGAVVSATMAPANGSVRSRVAAAVSESRLGGGVRRWRFSPGNLRLVSDFPASSIVVRRDLYAAALEAGVTSEQLVGWLHTQGHQVVYTPETVVVAPPLPLFRPYFRRIFRHARSRGAAARRTRGHSMGAGMLFSVLPFVAGVAGLSFLAAADGVLRSAGAGLASAYFAAVGFSALLAGRRFHSARVGLVAVVTLVGTHVAYVAAFTTGLIRGR